MPNTAQLVVISGKYIPSDLYKSLKYLLIIISVICTKHAITNMNVIVCKYSELVGIKIYLFIRYVIIVDIIITNVVDKPMPIAFFSLFEVPKNEHIPKNLVSIIFSLISAVINIEIKLKK